MVDTVDRGQRKGGTETHCGDTHEDNQGVEGSRGLKRKENAKLERTPKVFKELSLNYPYLIMLQ